MEKVVEVNGTEYMVVKLLGKGKGGYSYLVTDGEKEYVLKQIHHEPCEYYEFGDKIAAEERDYSRLQACKIRIPKLLAIDRKNERILKEYIKGDTIYEYVLRDKMLPTYLEQVREMATQVKASELNIDYFPTNFIVEDGKLWYIDYECNSYMEEWSFETWGILYWSKTKKFLEYAKSH